METSIVRVDSLKLTCYLTHMSHYGVNVTEAVNPGSEKHSRLQVFYQEDQTGYAFVRVTDVSYEFDIQGTGQELLAKFQTEGVPEKVRKEKSHYFLSAQEAREMAAELIRAAELIDHYRIV